MKKRDRIIAIVFLILCIGIYILIPYQIKDISAYKLKPSFFPKLVLYLMGMVSLLLFITSYSTKNNKEKNDKPEPIKLDIKKLVVIIAVLGYILTIDWIGFLLGSFLLILLLFLISGERKWIVMVLGAILLPGILYYIFANLFHVPLPTGIIIG